MHFPSLFCIIAVLSSARAAPLPVPPLPFGYGGINASQETPQNNPESAQEPFATQLIPDASVPPVNPAPPTTATVVEATIAAQVPTEAGSMKVAQEMPLEAVTQTNEPEKNVFFPTVMSPADVVDVNAPPGTYERQTAETSAKNGEIKATSEQSSAGPGNGTEQVAKTTPEATVKVSPTLGDIPTAAGNATIIDNDAIFGDAPREDAPLPSSNTPINSGTDILPPLDETSNDSATPGAPSPVPSGAENKTVVEPQAGTAPTADQTPAPKTNSSISVSGSYTSIGAEGDAAVGAAVTMLQSKSNSVSEAIPQIVQALGTSAFKTSEITAMIEQISPLAKVSKSSDSAIQNVRTCLEIVSNAGDLLKALNAGNAENDAVASDFVKMFSEGREGGVGQVAEAVANIETAASALGYMVATVASKE
ncbi:hypothetical protein HDU81_010185 [Chytriomyces hyalinus]|nr:hypothetical protein HDU81_010185 [Chytriomyces hyalinus]